MKLEELIKEIPDWESQYLNEAKNLTDREKEILKGDPIRSHEGMLYGRMYADWKRQRGWD